jgi:hypothetical protein
MHENLQKEFVRISTLQLVWMEYELPRVNLCSTGELSRQQASPATSLFLSVRTRGRHSGFCTACTSLPTLQAGPTGLSTAPPVALEPPIMETPSVFAQFQADN